MKVKFGKEPKISFVKELIAQHRRGGLRFRRADREAFAQQLLQGQWVADVLERRLAEIADDSRLTADGKLDAKTKAGEDAVRELKKWREPIMAGLDKHENALVTEIRAKTVRLPPADAGERMERALLRQELRAQVRGLDQIGRDLLYRTGNQTVRDAMDESPLIVVDNGLARVESFISPELRDEVALQAAETEMPEQADTLHDLRSQREVMQHVASAIEVGIKQVAPDAMRAEIKVGSTLG